MLSQPLTPLCSLILRERGLERAATSKCTLFPGNLAGNAGGGTEEFICGGVWGLQSVLML